MEFAHLARTFEELEGTSSRLSLIELVTQLFRSIEQPEEIEQVCYLMQGRVAPFYVALEMGMAEKSVSKAIALAYHSTPEHIEALYATLVIWDWSRSRCGTKRGSPHGPQYR